MVQTDSLKKGKILIICGATASGKTSLAVECALRLCTEVISADSMSIYKGFNIGTAKPSPTEMRGITHHMIDVAEPNATYSVADYRAEALPVLDNLISNGKIPIICGGTGFYIDSLIYSLSYGNIGGNPSIREKYARIAEEKGANYLHALLAEKDAASAEKLHPNDVKRVLRALEICDNGVKKSELNDKAVPNYDYRAYCFEHDRETLYSRIDARVDEMIKGGLIDEVKNLLDSGIDRNAQAMQGIGYKELAAYFAGEVSLEDAVENIKRNSRRYAKRQITYFKKLPNLEHLMPQRAEIAAEKIITELL